MRRQAFCIRHFYNPSLIFSSFQYLSHPYSYFTAFIEKVCRMADFFNSLGLRNPFRSPFIVFQKSGYAFLAISVSWVKAAASLTASSASIFRLISTPAVFRPCIKVE